MNKYAIILAAGKGSRMKSLKEDISKVSFPILGKPLVKYVIDVLKPLNCEHLISVIGFGGETSKPIVEKDCEVVWQREQKGAGHAVLMAAPILEGKEGLTIICCGDTPLLTTETIENLFKEHVASHNDLTIMTMVLDNPFGYGRIVKENGKVVAICEQRDTTDKEKDIKEVNAGVYIFDNKNLFECLHLLKTDNAAGEYYLTDVIGLFVKRGLKVGDYIVQDIDETLGVNDRYQLSVAAKILQHRINKKHMVSGVSIEDPENTYINPDVKIGQDTFIYAGCHILNGCEIGQNNVIGPDTYLENTKVGNGNKIVSSHIVDCVIEDDCVLGPYLRMRNNCHIESGAHISNFNELKNTKVGKNFKCHHLSYLGDSHVGDNVNIGCGTITANYDGVNKWPTNIGNDVFIGCNSVLIAPVTLDDGTFVAAGSVVTKDTSKDDLVVARAEQKNLKGYAPKIKEKARSRKK